jgi:hypothetical protein
MAKAKAEAESTYSVVELTAAAHVLNATPDLVKTALKLDGKEVYTLKEAQDVVTRFGSKLVK